jgi:hypothetical protein
LVDLQGLKIGHCGSPSVPKVGRGFCTVDSLIAKFIYLNPK